MLNTTHPLTDGLQGFWLPVHGRAGGSRLYDLSGRGPDGDLLNMDLSTDWTSHTERVHSVLDFDGSDDTIDFPAGATVEGLIGERHVSFWAWIYARSLSSNNFQPCLYSVAHEGGNGFFFAVRSNGGVRVFAESDDGVNDDKSETFGSSVNLNQWHHVGWCVDFQGELKAYVDGERIGSSSVSFANSTYSPTGFSRRDRIASNTTGGASGAANNDNWDGLVTAPFLSSAPVTDQYASALYDQARRGFPDLLRRRDSVGLLGGGGGTTVSLATTELQHTHTLEPSSVSAIYFLSTDELQQPHALGSPSVSVGYSLTTNELQQAHTLASPSLAIAGLLTPEDVRHGHTVESTLTDVQFALTTDALQQTHTLGASGVDVAYALTPQGLRHLQSLAPSTLEAIFGLTPEDLSQTHTIESPSGSGLVILSVDGMTHPHRLGQVTLGTVGFATKIDVSASPIYDTDSTAKELYQITLDATPILE